MKSKVLTDKEIREIKEDSLDFGWFAHSLRKIILSAETPITIGIHGTWGAGKTSLMRIIKELLKEEAITIWFNAWKYDKVYDLRVALIQIILREIGKDASLTEKARDFSKRINWLGVANIITSFVLGSPKVNMENLLRQDEVVSLINEFDDKFNELVKEYCKKKLLVIFVDDLDRCLPEKSIEMLEGIKLFLDTEGCVFIIGVNKRVIEEGVKAKYKGIAIEGTDYMEKIIQIPFNLPGLRQEDAEEFIRKIAPKAIKEYKEIAARIGGNPRKIKRMINRFILGINLAEERPKLGVDKEILAKLLVIELRWDRFYSDLITYYDKDLKTSLLLKELKELIDEKDNRRVKKELAGSEVSRRYYEDKTLINFLSEIPELWGLNLEPYIYLRKTTTLGEEEHREVSPRDINPRILRRATVNAQYFAILRILHCPEDKSGYGEFHDWGKWNGTEWHGYRSLPPGYWVYVYPYWFIWRKKRKL